MDSSTPGIRFDVKGVCNYCRLHDRMETRFAPVKAPSTSSAERIRNAGRKRPYDCVVGISGGTDSTYCLYVVKKLGLRPLAVHFDNGWVSRTPRTRTSRRPRSGSTWRSARSPRNGRPFGPCIARASRRRSPRSACRAKWGCTPLSTASPPKSARATSSSGYHTKPKGSPRSRGTTATACTSPTCSSTDPATARRTVSTGSSSPHSPATFCAPDSHGPAPPLYARVQGQGNPGGTRPGARLGIRRPPPLRLHLQAVRRSRPRAEVQRRLPQGDPIRARPHGPDDPRRELESLREPAGATGRANQVLPRSARHDGCRFRDNPQGPQRSFRDYKTYYSFISRMKLPLRVASRVGIFPETTYEKMFET